MRLVLDGRSDLERTERLATWLSRPAVDDVCVTLPWLDEDERHRVARAIQTYFNDCGCLVGAPAFVLALAWCLHASPWPDGSAWAAAGYTLLASVGAALAGKGAGLLWSRWRLRVLLRRMTHAEGRVSCRSSAPRFRSG